MKKLISLSLTLTCILCCFAGCGSELEGVETITALDNQTYAVVTDDSGELERDSNGNLIVAVTDEDGKSVTEDDGETATEIATVDHALIIGNTIELGGYYITIPDGWENNSSYTGIQIKKTNSDDKITIETVDTDYLELVDNCKALCENVKTAYPDGEIRENNVTINGEDCGYIAVYVPETTNGEEFYLGYAVYEADDAVYRFMVTAKRDVPEDDAMFDILNTVKYK